MLGFLLILPMAENGDISFFIVEKIFLNNELDFLKTGLARAIASYAPAKTLRR